MNVKRYAGKTTRDAMRLLREELGPDALILANRPCAEGVEILAAAADAAETLTLGAALQPALSVQESGFRMPGGRQSSIGLQRALPDDSEETPQRPARRAAKDALGGADLAPMSTVSFQDYVRQRLRDRQPDVAAQASAVSSRSVPPPSIAKAQPVAQQPVAQQAVAQQQVSQRPVVEQSVAVQAVPSIPLQAQPAGVSGTSAQAGKGLFGQPVQPVPTQAELAHPVPAQAELVHEMQALKNMIASQFDTMRWFDDIAREPMQAALLRQMMESGFSLTLARTVVGRLPEGFSAVQAQAWLATVLARNLRCIEASEGFDAGGVFALVGPTGVGKTTTTAKIAARHVLRHGAGSVALITVDTYRMGAHDQLRAYGRILNVPVHVAHDAAALHDLLRLRQERQLVLIDTVGMSQRDERIADLLGMLPSSQVQRVMVASAAAQPESIEESLQAYQSVQCRGLVLTKLDEAARLGGAIDCAIRARLPLLGVCDGQRVPEDWQAADASRLLRRALQARVPRAFSLEAQSLATAVGVAASQSPERLNA